MRVLITGAAGMLGHDVCAELQRRGHQTVPTARNTGEANPERAAYTELDILDTQHCVAQIAAVKPDAIINCAAWTNVDGAERDPDGAYRLNAFGAWNVATAAAQIGAALIHVSTDFVFDGTKSEPYTEFDSVNPLGVYGASKEAGERLVRQTLPDKHIIARTSWLFGIHGKNFVSTVQRLARNLPEVPIVCDQVGSPTATADLARKLVDLAEAPILPGTYHVSNSGYCSWYDFARAIVERSGLSTPVVPITGDEYAARFKSPTRRPAFSPMRRMALEMRGMDDMPVWTDALDRYLAAQEQLESSVK